MRVQPSRNSTLLSGETKSDFAKGGMRASHSHHRQEEELGTGWEGRAPSWGLSITRAHPASLGCPNSPFFLCSSSELFLCTCTYIHIFLYSFHLHISSHFIFQPAAVVSLIAQPWMLFGEAVCKQPVLPSELQLQGFM